MKVYPNKKNKNILKEKQLEKFDIEKKCLIYKTLQKVCKNLLSARIWKWLQKKQGSVWGI